MHEPGVSLTPPQLSGEPAAVVDALDRAHNRAPTAQAPQNVDAVVKTGDTMHMNDGTRRTGRALALAGVAGAWLALATAPATADIFLRLDGIPGESLVAAHANEIDVLSWSWVPVGSPLPGITRGARQPPCASTLTILKHFDKASPLLIASAATGAVIPTATITVRAPGSQPVDFLVVTLANVNVLSITTGGSGETPDRMSESTQLSYASGTVSYRTVGPTGALGAPTTANLPASCN